jgi:hypothetical protein
MIARSTACRICRCIGAEAKAALDIEFFQRMDEAQVAFLDQVGQRETAVRVVLGDADDQAQVVLDQPLARLEIAGGHGARQRKFLVRAEQQVLGDLVQVDLGDVVDEVDAESRPGCGQRQLGRPEIRFGRAVRRERFGRVGIGVARRVVCARDARQVGRVVVARTPRRGHAGGRYLSGSTGLPCRRISKCSLTWSASVLPISAIFCPRVTG